MLINKPHTILLNRCRRFVIALCLISLPVTVLAESAFRSPGQVRWDLCPSTFGPPPLSGFTDAIPPDSQQTFISADTATANKAEIYRMEGDVRLQRGDIRIHADRVEFDNTSQTATASGGVDYEFSGIRLRSEEASMNVRDTTGEISASEYWIGPRHLRGAADAISIEGPRVLQLNGASLTSCPDGKSDWMLRASELRLDQENNLGTAKHARLAFMQVPIFYFPYLSFPISGRKTGFLIPDIASSDTHGKELGVPYYWNIAPHRDATFTPYYYSDRGTQLRTEFRYLNPANAGQVYLEYLPNDDKFGDDRASGHLQHAGKPGPGWHTRLDAHYASDSAYLSEFGGELSSSSLTHLERRLEVGYQTGVWNSTALLHGYQTLDEEIAITSRPYNRLPQITINSNKITTEQGISTQFDGEFVDFDRSEGIIGRRANLKAILGWSYQRPAGFFTPELSVRSTSYRLERNDPLADDRPSRSLPLFSMDSGLFFERDTGSGDDALLHTLEPRLYYLYVPYRDQARLIVDENGVERTFDTGLPSLSFDQLFRDNRFTGGDRVGDANQLTMAVTTRFINAKGRELFSASLGQIAYFRDRRVTLPGRAMDTRPQSDAIAEIRAKPTPHLSGTASLLWDNEQDHNARGAFKFRYEKDQDRIADLAYRYERKAIEQADLSILWPLHRRWKVVGRYYYSFFDKTALERLLGVEYESCCWAIRFVSRDYISDVEEIDRNDTLWLQLELKGLTSVGKKITELFEEGRLE